MLFNITFNLDSKKIPIKFNENIKSFRAIFKAVHTVNIRGDAEFYEGEYEITPTNAVQVLSTKHKQMIEDMIINPIPKEYGLVTYNQNREIIIS